MKLRSFGHLIKLFDLGKKVALRVDTGHSKIAMLVSLQDVVDKELGITNCIAQHGVEVIGVKDISYD
jgi:hypothetical protein